MSLEVRVWEWQPAVWRDWCFRPDFCLIFECSENDLDTSITNNFSELLKQKGWVGVLQGDILCMHSFSLEGFALRHSHLTWLLEHWHCFGRWRIFYFQIIPAYATSFFQADQCIDLLTLVTRKQDQSCEHPRINLSGRGAGICVTEKSIPDCCPEVHNPFKPLSQHTLVCTFSCRVISIYPETCPCLERWGQLGSTYFQMTNILSKFLLIIPQNLYMDPFVFKITRYWRNSVCILNLYKQRDHSLMEIRDAGGKFSWKDLQNLFCKSYGRISNLPHSYYIIYGRDCFFVLVLFVCLLLFLYHSFVPVDLSMLSSWTSVIFPFLLFCSPKMETLVKNPLNSP